MILLGKAAFAVAKICSRHVDSVIIARFIGIGIGRGSGIGRRLTPDFRRGSGLGLRLILGSLQRRILRLQSLQLRPERSGVRHVGRRTARGACGPCRELRPHGKVLERWLHITHAGCLVLASLMLASSCFVSGRLTSFGSHLLSHGGFALPAKRASGFELCSHRPQDLELG